MEIFVREESVLEEIQMTSARIITGLKVNSLREKTIS